VHRSCAAWDKSIQTHKKRGVTSAFTARWSAADLVAEPRVLLIRGRTLDGDHSDGGFVIRSLIDELI